MDLKEKKKLLDKYIQLFQEKGFVEEEGYRQELDTKSQKKKYRKLETKDDVLRILVEEYLKEYKETEEWFVNQIHKSKTDVKNLKIKKKRLDTKTKEYEKDLKTLKRDLKKLTKQVDKLEGKIDNRNKESNLLDGVIQNQRKTYQDKEIELSKEIQGDGTDDEYYLNWFIMFMELQQLFDGKKLGIGKRNGYPYYRVRFFGGSGRGGFDIPGRIPIDFWNDLCNKFDREPTKSELLPYLLPSIKNQLKEFFRENKFDNYLRKKTKPIGSGYGKYKRKT